MPSEMKRIKMEWLGNNAIRNLAVSLGMDTIIPPKGNP